MAIATPVARRRFLIGAGIISLAPIRALAMTPRRIVALDWAAAETLIALGRPPIGMPFLGRFREDYPEHWLHADAVELGTFDEPNLEVLQQLRPDLMLSFGYLSNPALAERLRQIGEVRVIKAVSYDEPWAALSAGTVDAGRVTGQSDAAFAYMQQSEAELRALRAQLSRHAMKMPPILMFGLNPDGRHIIRYGALFNDIAQRLDLRVSATFPGPTIVLGVERLAEFPQELFICFDESPSTGQALARLEKSPLWTNLAQVRSNRILSVPHPDVFGAMPTALAFARSLTAAVRAHAA